MKSVLVVGVILVGIMVGAQMFLLREINRDHGRDVLVAYDGAFDGNKIVMHLSVPVGVVVKDPMIEDEEGNKMTRQEWVDLHYILYDSNGVRLPLQVGGSSALLSKSRASIAAEFFLFADLERGGEYVFDFVPIIGEANTYRYEFTAPTGSRDSYHAKFLPFEEDV